MDLVKLSKSLSWLLRHGAEKEGLPLEEGGFVDVEKILKLKQFRTYTVEDIQTVVNNNDKKRFSTRLKSNILQIRANQGHSLPVTEEGLLTMLTEETCPQAVFHGTYLSKLQLIQETGLSRMKRNHVHFAPKRPGDGSVISGMRKDCEVFIMVDTILAMRDGLKFYVSDNGVILCPGNENGVIPSKYFKEIWQVKPLRRLDRSKTV